MGWSQLHTPSSIGIFSVATADCWFDKCTTTADPWFEVYNHPVDLTEITLTPLNDKQAHQLKMESIPGKFKRLSPKPLIIHQPFKSKKLYECRRRSSKV